MTVGLSAARWRASVTPKSCSVPACWAAPAQLARLRRHEPSRTFSPCVDRCPAAQRCRHAGLAWACLAGGAVAGGVAAVRAADLRRWHGIELSAVCRGLALAAAGGHGRAGAAGVLSAGCGLVRALPAFAGLAARMRRSAAAAPLAAATAPGGLRLVAAVDRGDGGADLPAASANAAAHPGALQIPPIRRAQPIRRAVHLAAADRQPPGLL